MSVAIDVRDTGPRPRGGLWWAVHDAFWLGVREVQTSLRIPALWIPNLIMPIMFFVVMVGSLSEFAQRSGIESYAAFQLPVALLFAAQGGSAGLNMVADVESGYFDKLLLTPASRGALLIGAMSADFLRILLQSLIVAVLGLAFGTEFATGVPGMLLMVFLVSVWGLAYSAIGFAIALRTGNAQATQSVWVLTFPLMFLTTMFAPLEALSGWLRTVARYNPMTYVLDGMRSLSMSGWDAGDLLRAAATIAGFGALTLTTAFLALRSRVR